VLSIFRFVWMYPRISGTWWEDTWKLLLPLYRRHLLPSLCYSCPSHSSLLPYNGLRFPRAVEGRAQGVAIPPQTAYIHQPDARLSQNHIQDNFGPLTVLNTAASSGLFKGHEDNVCPLRRLKELSKWLR